MRLHFDGYEGYDFWVNADSPFIFHVGWSEKNGKTLMPPKGKVTTNFFVIANLGIIGCHSMMHDSDEIEFVECSLKNLNVFILMQF